VTERESRFDPLRVVAAKRDGREVSDGDLHRFILGYARGDIPDHLASAFLMAAYLNGLLPSETAAMTRAMIDSGSTLSLDGVGRPVVDKHSTGGVSDGVTLVFAPVAASLGMAVVKLSGRSLGHTGGTLDKLEAIPGLRTDLTPAEMVAQAEHVGCVVAGQSKDLVPADGALYALRDATGTVASVALIAASVMSKKLAVDSDLILLDVKAGNGAFMKTPEMAGELAEACTVLARGWGRPIRAAVTDMSQPLGTAVGNALEVAEAVRVLQGEVRGLLRDLAVLFVAEASRILQGGEQEAAVRRAERAIDSGAAAQVFARMVEAQGGDPRVIDDPWSVLPRTSVRHTVLGPAGYVVEVDTQRIGELGAGLGAGRPRKGDRIDPAVGIELPVKVGDRVETDHPIAVVHSRDEEAAVMVERALLGSLVVRDEAVPAPPLVYGWHGAVASAP
jgi:pyrimidine-nucleoside phosphorylase